MAAMSKIVIVMLTYFMNIDLIKMRLCAIDVTTNITMAKSLTMYSSTARGMSHSEEREKRYILATGYLFLPRTKLILLARDADVLIDAYS